MYKSRFPTNTLMFRFTVWYMLSLFTVIFLIGITIIGSVSYFLFQNTKQEMISMENKIKVASHEDKVDWQEALDQLLYPEHANYYVEIIDGDGKTLARSRGWEYRFDSLQQGSPASWVKELITNDSKDLFLTDQSKWLDRNGKEGMILVAVKPTNIVNFLRLIARILGVTAFIGIILGSLGIYFLTRQNMRPLFAITEAVKKIKSSSDLKQRVPVPNGPDELTDLSLTFNRVLDQLEILFDREKSFVANASHELRTPLTAMRGHLNLLNRWGKGDPNILDRSIQVIDVETKRMQRLISQLLALAHNDRIDLDCREVDLAKVAREAVELWNPIHDLSLSVGFDEEAFVWGDEDQLRQVVMILVENALKYTGKGGNVQIVVKREKDHVVLSVQDSGIGIPKEDLPKIFDRFYRVDKARSRKTGGTGLGLSIAKEIIRSHHGKITVESVLGQGSTFSVTLPRYREKINMQKV